MLGYHIHFWGWMSWMEGRRIMCSSFSTQTLGESVYFYLFMKLGFCDLQGFPVQQYSSGGMSGYPNQPLQYPAGPQQRCAPSPSYPSSRMPLMGQYTSGSHNPAQFPPGAGQPNPPQYYKVISSTASSFFKSDRMFEADVSIWLSINNQILFHHLSVTITKSLNTKI